MDSPLRYTKVRITDRALRSAVYLLTTRHHTVMTHESIAIVAGLRTEQVQEIINLGPVAPRPTTSEAAPREPAPFSFQATGAQTGRFSSERPHETATPKEGTGESSGPVWVPR